MDTLFDSRQLKITRMSIRMSTIKVRLYMPWTPTVTFILRVIQFLVHIACSVLNHCVLCFTLASVGGPFLCTNNGPALVSGLLPDFLRTRVGNSLTWSCEAVGQTPPEYRWLKNFKVSENFFTDDSRNPFGKLSKFVRGKPGLADISLMIEFMIFPFSDFFSFSSRFCRMSLSTPCPSSTRWCKTAVTTHA